MVHAAGNDGLDTDGAENYPRPQYKSMNSKFTNWIEVGASTRFKKAKVKGGYIMQDGLAADFSNYGNEMVDVFAPGHDIFQLFHKVNMMYMQERQWRDQWWLVWRLC